MMHTTLDIDGTQVGVFERAFDRLMSCRHTANSSIDFRYRTKRMSCDRIAVDNVLDQVEGGGRRCIRRWT